MKRYFFLALLMLIVVLSACSDTYTDTTQQTVTPAATPTGPAVFGGAFIDFQRKFGDFEENSFTHYQVHSFGWFTRPSTLGLDVQHGRVIALNITDVPDKDVDRACNDYLPLDAKLVNHSDVNSVYKSAWLAQSFPDANASYYGWTTDVDNKLKVAGVFVVVPDHRLNGNPGYCDIYLGA